MWNKSGRSFGWRAVWLVLCVEWAGLSGVLTGAENGQRPGRPASETPPAAAASERIVRSPAEFRQAVILARGGTRILLSPGDYLGGFYFADVRGESNQPVIIDALDPERPPVFRDAAMALHLARPAHVELRNLVISNMSGNGINIDDGGELEAPAQGVTLRNLRITDVGPQGNRDGIKLSGVTGFRVEGCVIERWGTGGGSGIDMVGCHEGVIRSNVFRHTDGVGSTGVQCKGGTTRVRIQGNRFENAGGRAVNIGGSTGLQFFRPPLAAGREQCEARDIVVEGNTFIGGQTAVAFVGVDGAVVRHNTIYRPQRWALRILQETRHPGFVPSRHGEFTDNIIVFHSQHWAEGGVNIGTGTAPDTFRFARNWWYCADAPARSQPRLPTVETDGVYGRPPGFRDAGGEDLRLGPDSPARSYGADGWRE